MRLGGTPGPGQGFLQQMADEVRREVRNGYYAARPETTLNLLLRPPSFARALAAAPLRPAIVGELKHASPGYQDLKLPEIDAEEFLTAAREARLDALSVIPQPHLFGGSLEEFGAVARGSSLPVLFKDFVVSEEQIEAATAWGASAVLLIARMDPLGCTELPLDQLVDVAHEHELEALVEVHSSGELPLALGSNPDLLGVNSRDLETFEISTVRACQVIAEAMEGGLPVIGMSGANEPSVARDYVAAGAHALLVGTEFVRSDDRPAFIAGLRVGGPR